MGRIVMVAQQSEVGLKLATEPQAGSKAFDRHIGKRQQAVENNPITLAQVAPKIIFQGLLGRRQAGSLGVVNEIEFQFGTNMAIAHTV